MSLSENLYNLGALIKTNLEKKGINGLTGNEGLTTLANKILDIEGKSVIAHVTGDYISLGQKNIWLTSIGDVVIDWGDGTSDTVNNPSTSLSHTYANANGHLIVFNGNITSLGRFCFYNCSGLTSITIPNSVTSIANTCFYNCSGLTSVIIPNSVTSLGNQCFTWCSGLTNVVIPDSVTSLGIRCFDGCSSLIDYQLYWTGSDVITYDSNKMPDNTNTIFTIPPGETSNYIAKGYPTNKLFERGTSLTLTCDKPIIQQNETSTVTATLKSSSPLMGKTLNYVVEHNDSVLDSGSVVTGSDGTALIRYVGTGIGDVSVKVSYGTLLQETYEVHDYLWSPVLDGTTGAAYQYSYSEADGEGVGKGFTLNGGFLNEGLWELSFEFKHDNIQYTGIEFLAAPNVTPNTGNFLANWEGSWPNGDPYATYQSGEVGWFDVTVRKIDNTHVRLISQTLNRDTTMEVPFLPNMSILSCGAVHNPFGKLYGPCRIRNVKVIKL